MGKPDNFDEAREQLRGWVRRNQPFLEVIGASASLIIVTLFAWDIARRRG